jgi:phospholipid/cholesterol/gamma-HCH transport system substrate-binding protein
MTARQTAAALTGMLIVVAAILLVASVGSSYRLTVQLANADGLESGSQVKIDGVAVGAVTAVRLGGGDTVQAQVSLDPGHAITSDATAQIVPNDLLGSMYLQITPGRGPALASGATIPASRVSYPVQLDQVLNVLDANTRARLAILIDQAGTALTGRRYDFNRVLSLLPPAFGTGAQLIGQLDTDNRTLANLVAQSSQFLAALVPQDRTLGTLIATGTQTMRTTARHQLALRRVLNEAPATLDSAQEFLTQLGDAAGPLGPAARAITATAPRLADTLAQVSPFQKAAQPALTQATSVAPLLTRLGEQATPVISAANPAAQTLSTLAADAPPLTRAAGLSIDNILGLIEGWARSIQGRDNIGHVFHGRALFGPEFINSLLNSLKPARPTPPRRQQPAPTPQPAGRPQAADSATTPVSRRPSTPTTAPLPTLLSGAGVSKLTGSLGALLGGPNQGSTSPQPPPTSSGSGSNQNGLGHLLGYLLGP